MKKTFYSTLVLFVMISAFFAITIEKIDPRVQKIDQQIERLEEMKQGYEARALRHENQAERLQFDDKAVLETKRHFQIADENRRKAAFLNEEIKRLKSERERIIKEK